MGNFIKYTEDVVREIFQEHGCKLLTGNYKNMSGEKLKFTCRCGNRSEIRLHNFMRSNSCKECGWERTGSKVSNVKRNKNFFETINTEEKAYWLGFILADGCVEKKLRGNKYCYRLSIEIKEDDSKHLEKFANIFGTTIRKRRRKKVGKYLGYVVSCYFTLYTKKIINDLINKGIVPRKTYKDCSSVLDNVCEEFIPDFIRGYFDGDGTVCIRKKDGIKNFSSASFSISSYRKEILEKIKKIMVKELMIRNANILERRIGNSSIFSLNWGGRIQLSLIYNYLYKKSTVFLNRKKIIFDEIYKYNFQQNKKKSSVFNGVNYFKPCRKWVASVTIKKKNIHIGYYDDEIEAAKGYDEFVLKHENSLKYKLNFKYK